MAKWKGFEHGLGIGGWLTNYKRFNLVPREKWPLLTKGDFEHFNSYITENDVKYIASLGADHIRLGFDQIVLEESAGVYREEIFSLIDAFIEWCEKYSLNVVLNLHKAEGNYCDVEEERTLLDDEEYSERFILLWEAFEKRYKDKPQVAFELLNEVRDVDPQKWNNLYKRAVKRLRALNKNRKIVIGSISWNDCAFLKDLELLDDDNIIYTFHTYAPHEFTHQKGVLQPWVLYNREMPYPSDIEIYRDCRRVVNGQECAYPTLNRMDKEAIRGFLKPAADFVKAHPEKILWCGEFGTIRHCKKVWRENWMRDVVDILNEIGISYCTWNYLSTPNDGNRFSLVDDDERKILSDVFEKIIGGKL